MTKCAYCGTRILFGGTGRGGFRYCNQSCQDRGALLSSSQEIPESIVQENVLRVHQGHCPKCGGSGPIDIHVVYRVWSALVITRWSNTPQLSCRSCGMKAHLAGSVSSLGLGWWGFPWGLVMTPIQVGRNIAAALQCADASTPSERLEAMVRLSLRQQEETTSRG